ncbi:MAG: SMI1/KNR4 family protein [Capsulimonas sp.]|uniref:SMI1/KNR4 family protein n=1 Tax=Capsulimonas sp. TaxID=2494211 RepID=UPI003266380B
MAIYNDGPSLCPPLTDEMLGSAERKLGYKLPETYINALLEKNGGYLALDAFPTDRPTNYAPDHVSCSGLFGIGGDDGVDSVTRSQYLIGEWDYPDVGIVFWSEGHTAFMLDYAKCGPQGEPSVIYVDTDPELEVIPLAPSFSAFIAGLYEHDYDDEK